VQKVEKSVRKLTIRPLEAKLVVNVCTFGQMSVFTEIKFRDNIFKTEKQSGMNPKWSESFQIEFSESEYITVGAYHKSMFYNPEKIGDFQLRIHDYGSPSPYTEWYDIYNNDSLTGSILLFFQFQQGSSTPSEGELGGGEVQYMQTQSNIPPKNQLNDHSVIQMISNHSSCDEDPMAESPYEEEDEEPDMAASPIKSKLHKQQ
jgi:hypothetical protein